LRAASLADAVARVKTLLLPPMKGNRVIVISRSGGQAIIAADECGRAGLVLPALPASFLAQLQDADHAAVIRRGNPLDLGADIFDVDALLRVMDGAMAVPEADAVVLLLQMPSSPAAKFVVHPERMVERAETLCRQFDKPLIFVVQSAPEMVAKMRAASNFPVFEVVEEAMTALAAGRDCARAKRQAPRRTPAVEANAAAAKRLAEVAPGAWLSQAQAFALLDVYEIAHPPVAFVRTAAEAEKAFARFRGPAAMKLESPDVVHKSDAGGVALDIETAAEAGAAFRKIRKNLAAYDAKARFAGAVLMPMAAREVELIAGVKRDTSFGPVLMLGWGGTIAEAMERVSIRLAPITHAEALSMLAELPGQKLLGAFRGRPAIKRAAVAELLVRLGQLACAPGVAEIDLNPVAVDADAALALDARVRTRVAPLLS